ncbi:MAG: RNA polymerase sigma factor [Acidobacteriota bacterium]|nr:RNA polymerase sigma factor [Acidobacteriota bacterium]MDH3784578.1 RNA polymerase sigma factor [Acidobacteriota bacterium]
MDDKQAKDDERDVRAARDGDARALESLLDRHQARVFRVLRLMGILLDDRDDVAQEVFIRIFRHLGSYDARRRFDSWVYRITVNAAHDHRCRHAGRVHLDADDPGVARQIHEEAEPSGGPDAGLAAAESSRELMGLLESLSARERAIFILCDLEERTPRQVARDLAISAITVRRHLGRARRHLRRLVDEKV